MDSSPALHSLLRQRMEAHPGTKAWMVWFKSQAGGDRQQVDLIKRLMMGGGLGRMNPIAPPQPPLPLIRVIEPEALPSSSSSRGGGGGAGRGPGPAFPPFSFSAAPCEHHGSWAKALSHRCRELSQENSPLSQLASWRALNVDLMLSLASILASSGSSGSGLGAEGQVAWEMMFGSIETMASTLNLVFKVCVDHSHLPLITLSPLLLLPQ